ncbi:MAG: TonB-dependent receptor [Steroidobacteraceae bacterium]
MTRIRFGLALASQLLASLFSQVTIAQEGTASSGSLLEEITVTAQRRTEKLQDVPLAITAVTDAQLSQLNITEAIGIAPLIPNALTFNNTGLGTANGYYIRGLGNTESIATFDPPVATYIDDIFVSRQNANNFGLFDVERIEILRGPQGTLFGRNTTGGAVIIRLRKPSPEFGGYMEAGFGQFGRFRMRGTVDLPISDRVLSKLSFYSVKDDGYVWNPVTNEDGINDRKSIGVHGDLRFLLSDSATWDLGVEYGKDDGANLLNFSSSGGPQQAPGIATAAIANIAARCPPGVGATSSRFTCTGMRSDQSTLVGRFTGNKQNYPLGNEVKNVALTSNVQLKTGLGEFNFITGYRKLQQDFALDFFNGTPAPFVGFPTGGFVIANEGEHKQISQEIKLVGTLGERITHTSGLFYFKEDNHTDFGDLFFLALGGGTIPFPLILEDRILDNTAKAIAAYSQWDFNLNDRWQLTVGGRWTDEDKEIEFTSNANPALAAPSAVTRVNSANIAATRVGSTNPTTSAGSTAPFIPLSQSTSQFTPRVALKFNTSENTNFYLSATNGFKSGGWNARGTFPGAILPFDPEKAWSYELGTRSTLADGRVLINLTAFFLDVKDLQTPSAINGPTGPTFITQNFADMENKGIEGDIRFQPVDDLELGLTFGFQSAEYTNLDPLIAAQQQACLAALQSGGSTANLCAAGIVDPQGKIAEPVRVPDTVTGLAKYRFHIGDRLTLTPSIVAQHVGANNVGTSGTPISLVGSYTVFNAGIQLANEDAGWTVQANCSNCTNEDQIVSVLAELPYIQDPRRWSINFNYRFGDRR